MRKIAVILFNLGGPSSEEGIKPFLFNLFNDPAIIRLPLPLRWLVAKLISTKRTPYAKTIYAPLGGKSPLLELTREQQQHIEDTLKYNNFTFKVFTSMRYSPPFSSEVVENVKQFNPDEIILLPLYPQFSTTTSASSIKDWIKQAKHQQLNAVTKIICCYNTDEDFIASHAGKIRAFYEEAKKTGAPRIIFSAHGLPKKVITEGDPYQWQIEQTAHAVMQLLAAYNADWIISYQSRVGPLEWITPSTEEEIIRAGKDKKPILIVPIAFVSEHSETLVELDITYKKLAELHHVPAYFRVPALSVDTLFIRSLCKQVEKLAALETAESYSVYSFSKEQCPDNWKECLCRR